MDENTPIEFQIETAADDAQAGLERVVSILERMEGSLTGLTSSLSKFKDDTEKTEKSFKKLRGASDRAFDSQRVVEFNKRLMEHQRLAKQLAKSNDLDDLSISKALSENVKEAERLNKTMDKIKPGSKAFGSYEAELTKRMQMLSDLTDQYNELRAARDAAAEARVTITDSTTRNDLDPDFEKDRGPTTYRIDPNYTPEKIQQEIDDAVGSASELEKRIRAIAEIKITTPEELAKALDAQNRFERARNTNEANIVKYTASGETSKAMKEAEKLAANEAGIKAFEEALKSADRAWDRLADGSEISITNPDEYLEAEKNLKKYNAEVVRYSAALKKAKAAGDAVAAGKAQLKLDGSVAEWMRYKEAIDSADVAIKQMRRNLSRGSEITITSPEEYRDAEKQFNKLSKEVDKYATALKRARAAGDFTAVEKTKGKLDGATAEMNRYAEALEKASDVRVNTENVEQLEDISKKIEKLRSSISGKEGIGRNDFNSPALRKMKIELTEAEIAAVRLKHTLGQLSTKEALAKNMGLVAKHTFQSRLHMKQLDIEAKKANRSLVQMSRVLQLMALRMGVRFVLKDMKAGFVALAQGYKPFNEAMSDMMDSSTQLRNNMVSMFQPLINSIAPSAVNAINAVANTVEKLTQVTAAMAGQSHYTKLTSEAQDFAKANAEVKKSLAGFDRFNLIGGTTGSNGEKFKTEVAEIPVPENLKKWKQVGDGIKSVFNGIGNVVDSIIKKFAKFLGLADDDDALKWIGDHLKAGGEWIQKNADGIATWVIRIGQARIALNLLTGGFIKISNLINGFKKVKGAFGTLFGAGSAAAASYTPGEAGVLEDALKSGAAKFKTATMTAGSFLKNRATQAGIFMADKSKAASEALKAAGVAFKTKALSAGTFLWTKLTTAGTFLAGKAPGIGAALSAKAAGAGAAVSAGAGKVMAGAAAIPTVALTAGSVAAIGGIAYAGYKDLKPEFEQLGKDFKEYAKERTGSEQNGFKSFMVWLDDIWRTKVRGKEIRQYAGGGVVPKGQVFIANERGPELVGNIGGSTGVLNQAGIVEAVSAGVERAVTRAMSSKNSNVTFNVRAEADANKLFKLFVEQHNAQFNRTGRSPLKV